MGKWTNVAKGIAAATIGAGIFGAIHFMFLAPQFGVGDIAGIPLSVVLPFLIGTFGLVGVSMVPRLNETIKDVVRLGSAASIGFGLAEYAGWITPKAIARARAPIYSAPFRTPSLAYAPSVAPNGDVKMI